MPCIFKASSSFHTVCMCSRNLVYDSSQYSHQTQESCDFYWVVCGYCLLVTVQMMLLPQSCPGDNHSHEEYYVDIGDSTCTVYLNMSDTFFCYFLLNQSWNLRMTQWHWDQNLTPQTEPAVLKNQHWLHIQLGFAWQNSFGRFSLLVLIPINVTEVFD